MISVVNDSLIISQRLESAYSGRKSEVMKLDWPKKCIPHTTILFTETKMRATGISEHHRRISDGSYYLKRDVLYIPTFQISVRQRQLGE